MALGTSWTKIASWSTSRNGATVSFYIDAKLNRQDKNSAYSVVDTRLTSALSGYNMSGTGYNFKLTGSAGTSGDGVWNFENETILTGQYPVYHDDLGNAKASPSAYIYNGYLGIDYSFGGSIDLPNIPRQATIKSAPNFNDEANPTITYSNPAGNSATTLEACISLDNKTDDISYRDISKTGTSYTFNLTTAERDVLRSACNTNSLSVYFIIKTIIGGKPLYSSLLKTMTIVNGNPTFLNFSYKDTNAKVTSVIGSDQTLVKRLSTLEVTIPASEKMIAQKNAEPKNYSTTVDNISRNADYSNGDVVIDLGIIPTAGNKRLNVRAYDSRNNSTLVYKDLNILDYEKPTVNATASRLNQFESETTLKISGKFSTLSVNGANKNTITKVQYRYKQLPYGEFTTWNNIPFTIKEDSYSCDDVILFLDNLSSFQFEIQAVDLLDTGISTIDVDAGKDIFFISSNLRDVFVNGEPLPRIEIVRW